MLPVSRQLTFIDGASQTLFTLPTEFRTGYAQLYNLTVERELNPSMSLEVGYVGSLSRKLPYAVGNINRDQHGPAP